MLAAFFICTEPVSGCKRPLARLLFGIGAGWLIYLLRTWGSVPDGTAFAILLMNLCVPALDRWAERRQPVST
jgi:electron transport complex protein RnfD